jgi:hypothetical protein
MVTNLGAYNPSAVQRDRRRAEMRTVYYCDLCGKPFNGYQECLKHEKEAHIKPKSYTEIESFFDDAEALYPNYVYLTMTDGAVVAYNITSILNGVDKEKAPNEGA